MQIIIAHSDKVYVKRLKLFFYNLNIANIQVFSNGFETLTYIIENRPQTILIEENLPGLNAGDITEILIIKRIKTKLIILQVESLLDAKIYQYSQEQIQFE